MISYQTGPDPAFCSAMLCKRGLCRHVVSVCPSVRLSDTFVHSVKTSKYIFRIFSQPGNHTILVFPYQTAQQYSDAPPPLTRAPNSGMVGRSRDSEPISEFTACCWRCYQPGVVNTTSSDHRPASCDTSLVVSGGVCWWRKKTAKFLWQEVSALRQRQQNSI